MIPKRKAKSHAWDLSLASARGKRSRALKTWLSFVLGSVDLLRGEREILSRNAAPDASRLLARKLPKTEASTLISEKFVEHEPMVREQGNPVVVSLNALHIFNHALSISRRNTKTKRSLFSRLPVPSTTFVLSLLTEIAKQLITWEFFLGLAFGITGRIATKIMLLSAIPSSFAWENAAIFAACAGAGMAAGITTHLVRLTWRNAKCAHRGRKENPFDKAFDESAVIGLAGGFVGGFGVNAGAALVSSQSFAVGALTAMTVCIVRALLNENMRTQKAWSKLAFQSAIFGTFGGTFGLVSSGLFGAHESVAASVPVGGAGSVIYVAPPPPAYAPDPCQTSGCQPPPPPAPIFVAPQPVIIHEPVHHVHHHHVHHRVHHHCHHEQPKEKICYPSKHIHHHHLVKNVKPVVQVKPLPPMPEPQFVAPVFVAPPPPMPIPVPPPDPCVSGHCPPPCQKGSQLDLKGPCGDPNTPCQERISFNDNGEATSVILEPRVESVTQPYFEIANSPDDNDAKVAVVSAHSRTNLVTKGSTENASKVALIVPVEGPTLTVANIDSSSAAA